LLIVSALGLPLVGGVGAQSLDDLLELPGNGDAKPAPTDEKPAVEIDPELLRSLDKSESLPNLLQQALLDMEDASTQLKSDAGLSTQRKMEEAISKLDRLIAEAAKQQQQQQQQQQQSSSSSSSQQQQSQQQQSGSQQNAGQQNQSDTGQQQGDSEQPQPNMTNNGESGINPNNRNSESAGPARPLKELGEEWGKLPARIRNDLLEGLDERFSPLYRQMTEDYYRRLAEEGK
jgi:hypothetical protein